MKLNFVVRESKVGKNATAPIELSITVNGDRKIFALDRRCNPTKWDAKKQKVKGSKELNDYIDVIRTKCYALYNEMCSLNLHITTDSFIYALKNGINNNNNSITIEQAFNDTIRAKSHLSKCTVSKYNSTLVYIKEFLKQEYGHTYIFVDDFTPNTCQLFFNYLLSKVSNNTAIYRFKHLCAVMIFC